MEGSFVHPASPTIAPNITDIYGPKVVNFRVCSSFISPAPANIWTFKLLDTYINVYEFNYNARQK